MLDCMRRVADSISVATDLIRSRIDLESSSSLWKPSNVVWRDDEKALLPSDIAGGGVEKRRRGDLRRVRAEG